MPIIKRKRRIYMDLKTFAANETVLYELSHAMNFDTFPHAVIIDGAAGTGKKTLADIIARYCVCLSDGEKPCGHCAGCLKALHGTHTDIFIADGNTPGALAIDAIRKIRSDAYVVPNEAPKKVYELLDCDKMQAASQNALLKILEEPPKNVVFVLTVTSANMLLQTVRSRSRIYTLYPPMPEQAAEYLKERYPEKNSEELLSAAILTDGNIGKAIQNIESGSEEAKALADEIMASVTAKREYDLLLLTSRLSSSREFAASVVDFMLEDAGECIRASVGLPTNLKAAHDIAATLSPKRIYMLAENIEKAKNVLKSNVNLNFFGTWLCAALRV